MKVRVDQQVCQGHTLCAMHAPEIFTLRDEDGHARVRDENVPPVLEGRAKEAALSCHEQAIILS